MAITKNTPTKKTVEHRTAEKSAIPKPVTAGKAASRTEADRQIRVEDSNMKPFTSFESPLHESARIAPELRQHMIRDAAYFHAERRGFMEGDPVRDWMEAEAEIDRKLHGEQRSTPGK